MKACHDLGWLKPNIQVIGDLLLELVSGCSAMGRMRRYVRRRSMVMVLIGDIKDP
jgi:hypothetical protein